MVEGSLTCASTLVPAPWFMETAHLQKRHPSADIGVHMTLAEYETYRWRSMTGEPSLHAPDGGMWRDVASVVEHVSAADAALELSAQVEHALASGIDVTHLDTHMGAVMHPRYLPAYVDLAIEFKLPVLHPAQRAAAGGAWRRRGGLRRSDGEARRARLAAARQLHRPDAERDRPEDKERRFRELFAGLRPGLTHFLVHPGKGGDELDAMTGRLPASREGVRDLSQPGAARVL